jgi:hypothetical protein
MSKQTDDACAFIDDVARIKQSIVGRLNDPELMNSCSPDSVVGAIVLAVSELAGHLAAKAGIPATEVIRVMVDAYEFEFRRDDEVVH